MARLAAVFYLIAFFVLHPPLHGIAIPGRPDEASVQHADQQFHAAFRNSDADALDQLTSKDFVWTHGTGWVQTRDQLLHEFRSSKLRYRELTTEDVRVRLYGDAGVVTGTSTRHYEGAVARFKIRYTGFYLRRNGHWQAVAFHTSELLPSGEPLPAAMVMPPGALPGSAPEPSHSHMGFFDVAAMLGMVLATAGFVMSLLNYLRDKPRIQI